MTMAVGTHGNLRLLRSENHGEQLLPGIPNEIAVDRIAPKLPWKAFHILSSVSRCWREAIRTHQIYDARVRALSAETFVVHIHSREEIEVIALYSTSDKRCYELPRIPPFGNKIPWSCQCISLDGKIYVIGGDRPRVTGNHSSVDSVSAEVFVLDVAGQRDWKQCASMQGPRHEFGCGILDGKIYVFGGIGKFDFPAYESEMYDPKTDTWSPIMPMPSLRYNHEVATIGEELYLYGGDFYDPEFFALDPTGPNDPAVVEYHAILDADENCYPFHTASHLEVYHPAKNEWRVVVEPFRRHDIEVVVMAKGKFHLVVQNGIDVYDMDEKSWTNRHKHTLPGRGKCRRVWPRASLAVNGELFLRVKLEGRRGAFKGARLLQSSGFSSENEDISWEQTSCSSPPERFEPAVMCAILL